MIELADWLEIVCICNACTQNAQQGMWRYTKQRPNRESQLLLSIPSISCGLFFDQYPYLHLEELEGDGDILQLLDAEDWLLVSGQPLAGEDLEEGDELEAVAEVDLEVFDLLVGLLQVPVRPSRERVLKRTFTCDVPLPHSGHRIHK